MDDMIASDNPLDADETATLRYIVGSMIPASNAYDVPGADDPLIFDDILSVVKANADLVAGGIKIANEIAVSRHGDAVVNLGDDDCESVMQELARSSASAVRYLMTLTAQCYYRDDRVMKSLGMEARPPFPDGHEVAPGDLSLLDPVRKRGPIWRSA